MGRRLAVGITSAVVATWATVGAWQTFAQESAPSDADAAEATDGEPGLLADELAAEAGATSYFADLASQLKDEQSVDKVSQLYLPEATREDALGLSKGRENIAKRLRAMLAGMQSFSLEVRDEFVSGDETVTLWTATFRHGSLKGGEEVKVDGITHIKAERGSIISQRDYFDLGEAVYENVTFVGTLVKWVKGKIVG